MDNYSITRNGKPLSTYQYRIDLENKVFSTSSQHLILDFGCLRGWTFKTGGNCTFKTGGNCTFKTGSNCTFDTRDRCTFDTGDSCTFKTGSGCTFHTNANCTFKTGGGCTFTTYDNCTFTTAHNCTFHTGDGCTFTTYDNCTFLLWDINTCKFKTPSNSIILDRNDSKHYILTKDLIRLLKVTNG